MENSTNRSVLLRGRRSFKSTWLLRPRTWPKTPSRAREVQKSNRTDGGSEYPSCAGADVLRHRRHPEMRFLGTPSRRRRLPPSDCPGTMHSINLPARIRPSCSSGFLHQVFSIRGSGHKATPYTRIKANAHFASEGGITKFTTTNSHKTTIHSRKAAITNRFRAISTSKSAGMPRFMPLTSANSVN